MTAPAAGPIGSVSLVVPVFNERDNILPLMAEVRRAMQQLGLPWEIVLVDDGSTDGGTALLDRLAAEDDSVRVVHFEANAGQTAAFDAGFRAARGDAIVTLDADLQNDPADIPAMMRRLEESKSDMVIGVRVNRQDTWARKVQSRIGNGVRNWITGDQITDTGCSLKLVKREAIDRVGLYTGMHRFLPTLVRLRGYKVIEMPVNHRARRFGVSKYGAMNRAMRGLVDCLAVRWMSKRMLNYRVKEDA